MPVDAPRGRHLAPAAPVRQVLARHAHTRVLPHPSGGVGLRALWDRAKERPEVIAAGFAGVSGGKATRGAACSEAAQQKGLKAGVLVKEVAQLCGGNGGGRPDFAMAGAKDQSKLDDALAAVPELVKKQTG